MWTNIQNQLSQPKIQSALTGLLELYFIAHVGGAFHNVEYALREEGYFENDVKNYLNSTNLNITNDQQYDGIFKMELAKKYITLSSTKDLVACLCKVLVSILIDNSGYWAARFFCQFVSFAGLCGILWQSPENSAIVTYLSFPLFYGGNTGIMLIHIFLSCMFPISQGKYMSAFKVLYAIEPVMYGWYKSASQNARYYFWFAIFICQPILWLRTVLFTPRRNVDIKNIRLGWQTRHDRFKEIESEPDSVEDDALMEESSSSSNQNSKYTSGTIDETLKETTEKKSSKGIFSYLLETIYLFNIPNILITFWVNFEILLGTSLFGQYISYLFWKIPSDSDQECKKIRANSTLNTQFAVVNQYMNYYNYSYVFLLISLPILGWWIDFVAKTYSNRKKTNIYTGQIFSVIILMLFVSASSILVHFFLPLTKIDETTCDFTHPWAPTLSIALILIFIGHIWTVRNIYVISANKLNDQGRILMVNNMLQAGMHVLIRYMPQWVQKYFGNDWDKFFRFMGYIGIFNLVVPVVGLFWWHFIKKN